MPLYHSWPVTFQWWHQHLQVYQMWTVGNMPKALVYTSQELDRLDMNELTTRNSLLANIVEKLSTAPRKWRSTNASTRVRNRSAVTPAGSCLLRQETWKSTRKFIRGRGPTVAPSAGRHLPGYETSKPISKNITLICSQQRNFYPLGQSTTDQTDLWTYRWIKLHVTVGFLLYIVTDTWNTDEKQQFWISSNQDFIVCTAWFVGLTFIFFIFF